MKRGGTEDVEWLKDILLRQTGIEWNKACSGQILVRLLAVLGTLLQVVHAYQGLDMGRGIFHIRCGRTVVGKIADSCVKTSGNLVAQHLDTADTILPCADIRSCYLGKVELESRTSIDNR